VIAFVVIPGVLGHRNLRSEAFQAYLTDVLSGIIFDFYNRLPLWPSDCVNAAIF